MALPQLSCQRLTWATGKPVLFTSLYVYKSRKRKRNTHNAFSVHLTSADMAGKVCGGEPGRKAGKLWPGKWKKVGETRTTFLMISTSFYKSYPIISASVMIDQKCSSRRVNQPLVIWPGESLRAKAAIPTTPLKLPRGPRLQAS